MENNVPYETLGKFAERFPGLKAQMIRRLCEQQLLSLPRLNGWRVIPRERFGEVEKLCRQFNYIQSPEQIAAGKRPGYVHKKKVLQQLQAA